MRSLYSRAYGPTGALVALLLLRHQMNPALLLIKTHKRLLRQANAAGRPYDTGPERYALLYALKRARRCRRKLKLQVLVLTNCDCLCCSYLVVQDLVPAWSLAKAPLPSSLWSSLAHNAGMPSVT